MAGLEVLTIPRETFNHGATRQYAFEQLHEQVEFIVFMTQDAVLADNEALAHLLSVFVDPSIAAAYGRQRPHPEAGHFGTHARLFNYGPVSMVKQLADRDQLGIRTCFLSNSFAAYRCRDLQSVGGFPVTDFGEDMLAAAHLLLEDHRIAYVSEACVYHSHDYSILEEFHRYRTTGQLHGRYPWLLREFGGATGEGKRFALSEVRFLLEHSPLLLPIAAIRTLAKFVGYQLGRHRSGGLSPQGRSS